MMCWDAPELTCAGLPETDVLTYELLLATPVPHFAVCGFPIEWVMVGQTTDVCAANWIPEPPVGAAYFARVRARDPAGNTSDQCGGDDGDSGL